MSQENITNLWRYNINLTTSRNISPRFSASSALNTKPQYRISLFNKESKTIVKGLISVDAIKFLREIAPQFSVKHFTKQIQTPICKTEEDEKFLLPVQFHMMEGLSISEMLFLELSAAEASSLSVLMNRGLAYHPESKNLAEGIDMISNTLYEMDSDFIWNLIKRYVSSTKCAKLHVSPWVKLPNASDGTAMSGKVTVYYHENATRPFSIRIVNMPTEQIYPAPAYPMDQASIKTHIISLTSEEFIGQFLIPICEDNQFQEQ